MPHQTIDAIIVATNLVTQLQSIVSRNIDPTETAVLTVGKISGGTALNVIADDAQIMGTIRYNAEDVREKLHSRIRSLAKGLALAYECQIDVKMMPSYPPTINHPVETENVFAAVSKVVGPGMAIRMEKGLNASEGSYIKDCKGQVRRGLIILNTFAAFLARGQTFPTFSGRDRAPFSSSVPHPIRAD